MEMENREDLTSILPFLPLCRHSSALFWPPAVVEALKSISRGPIYSNVNSGHLLAVAISDIRNSLGFPSSFIRSSASLGLSLFFDDLMGRDEARNWFGSVLPRLADLLLELPSLLEIHYKNASKLDGKETSLRLLDAQQAGIVILTQDLIAALLACAFFCLFPTTNRGAIHLPRINFNNLFVHLHDHYDVKQENKIKCIVHYFERICSCMPRGKVSFERKVLVLENTASFFSYPKAEFWSRSSNSLCCLEVHTSGLIEDQTGEALEVDFANKCLGGGALGKGCVQEEIRFMINPELIAGMLFLPSMEDNEAIEIIGTERFSNYTGYASSFCFFGDHVDTKDVDSMGRRKTRIIAIDALSSPRMKQYKIENLLREINKAFCGFYNQCKCQQYQKLLQDNELLEAADSHSSFINTHITTKGPAISSGEDVGSSNQLPMRGAGNGHKCPNCEYEIGIATGNWGCGAFGGDPQIKAVIQWLAASQALRPFLSYYTFGSEPLEKLDLVAKWIISQEWTVGDLWNMLVEYSTCRLKRETKAGFFTWLLPSLYGDPDIGHSALSYSSPTEPSSGGREKMEE